MAADVGAGWGQAVVRAHASGETNRVLWGFHQRRCGQTSFTPPLIDTPQACCSCRSKRSHPLQANTGIGGNQPYVRGIGGMKLQCWVRLATLHDKALSIFTCTECTRRPAFVPAPFSRSKCRRGQIHLLTGRLGVSATCCLLSQVGLDDPHDPQMGLDVFKVRLLTWNE